MDTAATTVSALATAAPAKINLALHVVGRRADGYHELDSLVVFTHEGDELRIEDADRDTFSVSGRFADGVPRDGRNIVLKALELAREVLARHGRALPPRAIHLRKELPPSSGIGGGSADAAALLRLVARSRPDAADALAGAAVRLGADVPMCLRSRSARVTGVGERIEPVALGSAGFLLLANPLVEVSTPAVFAGLARRDHPPMPGLPAVGFADHASLLAYLGACRNDLAASATAIAPAIDEALAAIRHLGASLTRMSGSGATAFGLFEREADCREAATRLARARPDWWVRATALRSGGMT